MVITSSDKPINQTGRLPSLLRALGRGLRVMDYGVARGEGQKAGWEVDVKDPTPRIVIVIQPPRVGPTTGAIRAATPNSVIALPCFSRGKASSSTPWLHGCTAACQAGYAEQNQLIKARGHPQPEATVNTAIDARK
jgi:hypothetical protein